MLNITESVGSIESMKTGISDSRLNLRQAKLMELTIPLYDLPIQRQIVARIESIESHRSALISQLDRSSELLNRLETSILTSALNGEVFFQAQQDLDIAEALASV